MVEMSVYADLNVWGPNGSPTPDLLPLNENKSTNKKGLFARMCGGQVRFDNVSKTFFLVV